MTNLKELEKQLRALAKTYGVKYFGIGDLRPAKEFIMRQGGEFLGEFPYGISLGYPLSSGYVDILPLQSSRGALTSYEFLHHHVDHWMDMITVQLSRLIEEAGYKAFPAPSDEMMNRGKALSVFSHKITARQAGIGWIGKNNLIITPEIGPRMRLTSIMTTAPFEPSAGTPMEDKCGSCTACVEICPVKAVKGRTFNPEEGRKERLEIGVCVEYRTQQEKNHGAFVCGLCMYACPYGKKK